MADVRVINAIYQSGKDRTRGAHRTCSKKAAARSGDVPSSARQSKRPELVGASAPRLDDQSKFIIQTISASNMNQLEGIDATSPYKGLRDRGCFRGSRYTAQRRLFSGRLGDSRRSITILE